MPQSAIERREFDPARCNSSEGGKGTTTPVGAYSPLGDSPYGAADMVGNVWEWTQSLWGKRGEKPDFKYPYDPKDGREDTKAGNDVARVVRGGSWEDFAQLDVRPTYRLRRSPFSRNSDVGFRVVVAPVLP